MLRFSYLLIICFLLPLISCTSNSTPKADVVFWHWMTDRQDVFETLAAKYEKETGVKVLFETYAPSNLYREKVRAAASGSLLPEIFSPLGDKRETASFINAGYIADLTEEMEGGWEKRFFKKSLSQSIFEFGNEWNVKPGIYGAPIDVNAIEIFYNKTLFKQAGLDPEKPPLTWDEFISAGKKLRAAGIQPFASGFGEGWLVGVFAASYEWNLLGKEGIIGKIKGTIPYTDPRIIRIFKLFEEMRDAKMFASGVATMVNKDAERAFATGKVAMALNGSWGVNVYRSMNSEIDYGIMMPPKLKEGKFPLLIFGGEGTSLNINPLSPNKDKAIAFLKWLTDKEQQVFLAKETMNIPSNREAAADLPPILRSLANDIDKTFETLPVIEQWQVVNAFNQGLQSIIIGEKTAEKVAKDIQAEKGRQQNKK